MVTRKISWPSFFIGAGAGFVLGVLVLGVLVNYLIRSALSSSNINGQPLSSVIEQVQVGLQHDTQEQQATTVYGQVVSNTPGTLVLAVYRQNKNQNLTFTYDSKTTFVQLANDDASSELPLSSDAITKGDRLTVFTNEPIGSVENQHAVKVVKM